MSLTEHSYIRFPSVSLKLWNLYIVPCLAYGLEISELQAYLLDKLELVQRKHLKRILFLPASTANSAVHLITGTLPIRATIHQRALGFPIRILHNPDTMEYNILTR